MYNFSEVRSDVHQARYNLRKVRTDVQRARYSYKVKMFVCLSVRNSWGHNAEKLKMMKSSLLREWVSILSECVYVKFHQIDFCISHDVAKNSYFFGKYW